MLIKRLNKIIDILNKKNHTAGIGPDIDQIRVIITYYPGNSDGEIKLETMYYDHSIERKENYVSRFWQDNIDKLDLQKYVRECLEQLKH